MEWAILLPISIVVFTFGTIFAARQLGKTMVATSDEDLAVFEQLKATGGRARATLTTIQPAGLTVDNVNVQCHVGFWLVPLDGSEPFEGTKTMFFVKTQLPDQGDTWPAWYDLVDRSVFAVLAPTKLEPNQIPMYRDFGIQHPLDPDRAP